MEAKTLWQKNKWILYLAIVVFIASFILDKCNNSEVIITVPEQTGETIFIYPKNTPIEKDTILLRATKWYENKKQNNFLQSEIDKLISESETKQKDFDKLFETSTFKNDSLQKLLYAQAIQLNSFHETIDNDTVRIDAIGITEGKLKTLKIDWKVKEKKITVPIKSKIGVYLGSELGANKDLNQFTYKANLGIKNKKGTIYRASYQRVANEDFGLIGVDFKLF
ncbi:hypothetical protein [Flavobacterium sp.]|uniref:hypothetical protein n=1 Tax=Flavobacterium sp. TaxID=239 RepID=UPI0037522225